MPPTTFKIKITAETPDPAHSWLKNRSFKAPLDTSNWLFSVLFGWRHLWRFSQNVYRQSWDSFPAVIWKCIFLLGVSQIKFFVFFLNFWWEGIKNPSELPDTFFVSLFKKNFYWNLTFSCCGLSKTHSKNMLKINFLFLQIPLLKTHL